jgi:predicted CXXCH cytochrome family protein
LLTALLGALSCAPEKQHEVLTFFFDGVPPLGGSEQAKTQPKPGAPSALLAARPKAARIGSEHDPTLDLKGCGTCHNWQTSFNLVKPVEELCVTCHSDKTRQFPQMHGPAAVGACAQCHDGHRSAYPHLLLKPPPQLCFECHDRTASGEKTLGCPRPSDDAACTSCHNPHGGKDRFFLVSRPAETEGAVKAPAGPAPEAR